MGAFSLQIAEFAKKAGDNAELVVRKVGIDVLSNVIRKSPVDTGRFRANWQVGLTAVGERLETTDPSGQATISKGTGQINEIKLGESVWISNSLPYAQRLENGYSQQAPAGMVALTITEFRDYIAEAVRQLP